MLLELHIRGLGVIGDVTLEIPPGLSVLTGETGAGKTMVTTGLALVLGRRAQAGLVRTDAGRAAVEARFEAHGPAAEEWSEDGDLILARTIGADGRSTARAGGQIAPLSALAELGERLVEVHGQHSAQRLLVPGAQLAFLDRFCGPAHAERLDAYRVTHGSLRDARARLARIDDQEREREREKDLLAYQVREIESAGIRSGEVAELERDASRLEHAERLRERASEAAAAMGDDAGAVDALRAAGAALEDASSADPGVAGLAERVASLAEEAADAAGEARKYAETLELDPARLDEIRERVAAIRSLE
ncbi:MAG: AAA family ATPase, partial [Actinomycetota bacterium]